VRNESSIRNNIAWYHQKINFKLKEFQNIKGKIKSKFPHRGTGGLLTKEEALQKLRQYCAYQERSHYEVQQKLYDLGIRKQDHDEIISTLIEEDYLNEERFAKAFAGGKFRMKDWGRKKIYHALKEKRVSEYSIKQAMKEIDDEAYKQNLKELVEEKYELLKGEQFLVRKKKTIDYMLQKGYELDLVTRAINELIKK
jgi:regulatory protein